MPARRDEIREESQKEDTEVGANRKERKKQERSMKATGQVRC